METIIIHQLTHGHLTADAKRNKEEWEHVENQKRGLDSLPFFQMLNMYSKKTGVTFTYKEYSSNVIEIYVTQPDGTDKLYRNVETFETVYDCKLSEFPKSTISQAKTRTSGKPIGETSFKQQVVNEYLKKGYRAPQNEITKYLLHGGRDLVLTRGK